MALVVVLSGCASLHYNDTETGTLKGRLTVEWFEPNLFIYEPDPKRPLTFIRRKNGDRIQPAKMITDGGSIPRPFWIFRNYSPWGYGPAFVVHDWLFHMQNCKIAGYEKYSLKDAAQIMSEIMKTLMERPTFGYGSKTSMYLMYEAVQSPVAAAAWRDGMCTQPPDEHVFVLRKPTERFVIEFP